jgi:hypothetical protein
MAKTTKTTATKPAQTTDQDKISIPVAIRGGGKSAGDLLAGLASKAKAPEKKADAKKQHPELQLQDDTQQLFTRFAKVKQLYDVVEGELDSVKGELNENLFDAWTTGLWTQKAWASSPAIKVRDANGKVDAEGLYIVQEKFKLQIPDNDNPVDSIIEGLVAPSQDGDDNTEPLTAENAAKLVENEVDFSPQLTLRPFNELVVGHYVDRQLIESTDAEKAVGQKLLEFVTNHLTAEEQALVLVNKPNTVVKKGVLQRITTYVKSKKQLVRALQYFVPVNYPKGAKFGVTLTPVTRAEALADFAEELLVSADLDAE